MRGLTNTSLKLEIGCLPENFYWQKSERERDFQYQTTFSRKLFYLQTKKLPDWVRKKKKVISLKKQRLSDVRENRLWKFIHRACICACEWWGKSEEEKQREGETEREIMNKYLLPDSIISILLS